MTGAAPVPPVFVYGALRSGTTLFRLMLDGHPGIANPGETDFLFDHIAPDPRQPCGWAYDLPALAQDRIFRASRLTLTGGLDGRDLLDDLIAQYQARSPGRLLTLNIHRHIDRVLALYPQARVIHMLRDPRDVARSSIAMGWAGSLYYGVDHWLATERAWDAGAGGADPAQVHELRYEDLVAAPAERLAAACAFMGLPYDEGMLRYHETSTYAAPDGALIEQWRRKCTPAEVALLESKAAPMMRARGYVPTDAAGAPGPTQQAGLFLQNKIYKWRFGIRRSGLALWLGERLARRLRLRGLHRRLTLRIDAIVADRLK